MTALFSEKYRTELEEFCRRKSIRSLSLFGSMLHGDFHADSDTDLLVEFEPDQPIGLLKLAQIEMELGELTGRRIDLRTAEELSRYFRQQAKSEARVLYAKE